MTLTEDNKFEYIFRYLENDLSELEKKQFEELIKNNQTLKDDISLCKNINGFLKEHAAMLEIKSSLNEMRNSGYSDEIKDMVKEHNKKLNTDKSYGKNFEEFKKIVTRSKRKGIESTKIKKLRPLIYVAAAAITILLVTTISILYFFKKENYTPDDLFCLYYEKYQPDIYKRSISDKKISEIKKYYCSGKYEAAVDSFKRIENPSNADIFYTAMSYIELKKFEDAAAKLEFLLRTNNSFFITAEWYAGLCYVKTGNYSKAFSLLNECAQRKSVYRGKVKELLEKLEIQNQKQTGDH
ncbi:MAG: tetratricopeptide repeat protein [Bacteroidia bacterium]|nr:tetratricopeptide repeat protein [Bacteroidia bacterium]